MGLSAREIAATTGGIVAAGDPDVRCTSFAIDSRVLVPGACFVALVAARDGHDFVHDAFARGAAIALVGRDLTGVAPGAGQAVVRVADPLAALQHLAATARATMTAGPVVGITGSVGKTGTKDLTAAALAPRFVVHASPGSFNNEAGLPLTLLHAPDGSEAVVLEMGARFPGNIAELCVIARPTVGVITKIGLAHVGLLGGPEGVARTKGELLEALGASGLAVLDADDPFTPGLVTRTGAHVVLVTTREGNGDVHAHSITLDDELRPTFLLDTPWGSGPVRLAVRGAHQVTNAALAAAVALAHGVPFAEMAESLATVEPAPWRMEVSRAPSGALVIDDTYNANPSSTTAAVGALAHVATTGRRIAVLGEMLELGDHSEAEHADLGRLVAERGIDVLVVVGAEAAPTGAAARAGGVEVYEATDAAAAATLVAGLVHDRDVVLVKGSRAVGLEAVARALTRTGIDGEVVA
jgi:UDP-N-acetylmuramoyl-tripeptide--D-alanyl-D-alanine ligase